MKQSSQMCSMFNTTSYPDITLTFKNYRLEKKSLQELREEKVIIMSSANNSEICPFIKFVWEHHQQLAIVTIVRLIHY